MSRKLIKHPCFKLLAAGVLVAVLIISLPPASGTAASPTNWFRWNWLRPLPQGNPLAGVWCADANHVWATGDSGTILMWNGFNWVQQTSGVTGFLEGLSGLDANHVWATGDSGTILFYDGKSWSPQASGAPGFLSGVNALDATHVWTVGDAGAIRFFDGNSWATQASGTGNQLFGVSAVDASNVWAVGNGGTVLHFNGTSWSTVPIGTASDLFSVSALDANHVWVVGRNGTVGFFNGTTWSLPGSGTADSLLRVSALDPQHVWAAGINGTIRFFDGVTWSGQAGSGLTSNSLNGLFVQDATHGWIVGDSGVILTFDGTSWNAQSSNTEPGETLLRGISAADASHIWAVGEPFMAAGQGYILFSDGNNWTTQATGLPYHLTSISALDPTHVWAVGDTGNIVFFDGTTWTNQLSGTVTNLSGVSALDSSHVWAVGAAGTVLFFNGTAWGPPSAISAQDLNGVSALDVNHVWAAGINGTIAFFNGTTWSPQLNLGPSFTFNNIYALDANHVWAVGNSGLIEFFDGNTWSAQSSGVTNYLQGVKAVDANHVWAVGGSPGNILFFDGSSWTVQDNPAKDVFMESVTALDVNHVWTAGGLTAVLFGSQEATSWDLAEGASTGGFETWILVQNPGDAVAHAKLTYMTPGGAVPGPALTLAPHTRQSVNVADVVKDFSVSTSVSSDNPVVCERAVYFANRRVAHSSVGTIMPGKTWFLAEGSTAGGFETWVLVQNPGDTQATGTITYMTPAGPVNGPNISLSPHTRMTVRVNDTIPNNFSVSTQVKCDVPVVAERATYWNNRIAGQESIGVTNPAQQWFLAEGSTAGGFETWVLVQNPGTLTAKAHLTYMTPNGAVNGPDVTLAPGTRQSVKVNDTVPNNFSVSTSVTSDQPVVAERAMYWNNRVGGHDSVGVTGATTTWYLAEGATAAPFQTWILVQNPGPGPANVRITYMTSSGQVAGPDITLPPNTRQTVNVGDSVPNDFNVSTSVTSDNPVVAERATYLNGRNQDGTESIGFTP